MATLRHLALSKAMVFCQMIGCDLGPKITPIGNWLRYLARTFAEEYDYQLGILLPRCGIIMTLPVLFVTLAALALRLSFTL